MRRTPAPFGEGTRTPVDIPDAGKLLGDRLVGVAPVGVGRLDEIRRRFQIVPVVALLGGHAEVRVIGVVNPLPEGLRAVPLFIDLPPFGHLALAVRFTAQGVALDDIPARGDQRGLLHRNAEIAVVDEGLLLVAAGTSRIALDLLEDVAPLVGPNRCIR